MKLRQASPNNKSMEETAAVSGSGQWYEDGRYRPQQQAEYLTKLSKLRSDLFQQEQSNVSQALCRFQAQSRYRRQVQKAAMDRNARGQQRAGESVQERHRRVQQEKACKLQAQRKGKPSPKLETLQGQKALETDDSKDEGSAPGKNPGAPSDTDIGDVIAKQKARLKQVDNFKVTPRGGRRRRPTPPNSGELIERRSLRQPGRLLPLRKPDDASKHSSSGSTGVKLSQRRHRQKPLVRGDSDLLDLCPDSYKLETNDRGDGGEEGDNEGEGDGESNHTGYSVPTTTPASSAQGERSYGYVFPGNRARVPLPTIPYAQSYRLRHLRQRGLIRQWHSRSLLQNVQNDTPRKGFKSEGSLRTKVALQMKDIKEKPQKRDPHPNPKNCILCEHPELMPRLIPICTVDENEKPEDDSEEDDNLKPEFVHSEDNISIHGDVITPSPSPVHALKADIHIPQAGLATPTLSRETTRTSLSADMPNFVFNPPTPVPVVPDEKDDDHPEQTEASSLTKTVEDNQARGEEIKTLLQDLNELHGLTTVLEKEVSIE